VGRDARIVASAGSQRGELIVVRSTSRQVSDDILTRTATTSLSGANSSTHSLLTQRTSPEARATTHPPCNARCGMVLSANIVSLFRHGLFSTELNIIWRFLLDVIVRLVDRLV